jgi:hypothetical protein
MKSGQANRGQANPSAYGADFTRADLPSLPAHSLRPDPFDDIRRSRSGERAVTVLLTLLFLIPMVLAGIMMGSR